VDGLLPSWWFVNSSVKLKAKHQSSLPYIVAFILPLGFLGVGGIAGLLLFSLRYWREIAKLSWAPLLAALPFAAVTVIAAALGPDPEANLLPAIGQGVLYTFGLQAIRAMVNMSQPIKIVVFFLIGSVILALSVCLDFVYGWHTIPAGLFWHVSLHNWTASYLVIAFPFALALIRNSSFSMRCLGILASLSLCVGIIMALSWVGLLGLIASGLVYIFLTLRTAVAKAGFVFTAITGGVGLFRLFLSYFGNAQVKGFELETLGQVIFGRLRIFTEGLELASQRPWLGWGFNGATLAFKEFPVGTYYHADLVLTHFHNLYIQTLFETGLFGFVALMFLLGFLYLTLGGKWGKASKAALLGFLVTQLFDYAWLQSSLLLGVWLAIALGMQSSSREALK
jgi:O-antigen ligase